MSLNMLIDKDENTVEIDITKYRGIIRSLLYLIVSRPCIMFSVYMFARYQVSPYVKQYPMKSLSIKMIQWSRCSL